MTLGFRALGPFGVLGLLWHPVFLVSKALGLGR